MDTSSPRAHHIVPNPNPNPNPNPSHNPNPNPNPLPSPTTSTSSGGNNNGAFPHHHHHHHRHRHHQPLSSPKLHLQQNPSQPVTRSEPNPNPYPTTFVQADTSSFKQVVQMLTGSSKPANPNPIPPVKTTASKSKTSKLYERRNSLKNNLRIINPSGFGPGSGFSPRHGNPELLSPSLLDFPALTLSPVTPLIPDPFNRSPAPPAVVVDTAAEEKAIAEKGFFLHPSPASTPRDSEPRLLPLFPESSPRMMSGSNPSS